MPETIDPMIVHHTGSLHERIADGAAHEAETALLQVLAHCVGFRGTVRRLATPVVDLRLAAHEGPDVLVEAAELLLHREESLGIPDAALDLEAVTHDAGILEQPRHVLLGVASHLLRVEAMIGAAVVVALVQDGGPGEPRLGALQDQELEQQPLVVERHTPFLVVVSGVDRIGRRCPGTTDFAIGMLGLHLRTSGATSPTLACLNQSSNSAQRAWPSAGAHATKSFSAVGT